MNKVVINHAFGTTIVINTTFSKSQSNYRIIANPLILSPNTIDGLCSFGKTLLSAGKGYGSAGDRKYRGWFVGMAPIDKPRVIVAVMIDEPRAGKYFGGDVAAPVFSEVVQQVLRMQGVQPDMGVKPQIVTNPVEESF